MIGAGLISEYHMAGIQATGMADITLVCSRSGESARAVARRFGIGAVASDWRLVLEQEDIDAVVIATPDHTHEEIAVRALRAGKHVLLQKPMAQSVEACERIASAAADAGTDLQVSFMHRYFEEVQLARELILEGLIGRIESVRMRNATPGPDWSDWFFDAKNPCNDVVHQLGVHGIDLTSWLVGPIQSVSAQLGIQRKTRTLRHGRVISVGVADSGLVIYKYASGAIGTHEMSMIEAGGTDRFRMEIYGENGVIFLRTEKGPIAVYAPQRFGAQWHTPTLDTPVHGQRHHQAWLSGLVDSTKRQRTAQEAMEGMKVIAAIARSAANSACLEHIV